MNVKEVTEKLKEYGITDSEQMVRRWIRNGEIKSTEIKNRKAGYDISKEDLIEFVKKRKPEAEYKLKVVKLEKKIEQLKSDKHLGAWEEKQNMKKRLEELEKENKELQNHNWDLQKENRNLKINIASLESQLSARELSSSNAINVTGSINNFLGLPDTATKQEVRKVFKQLLKAVHPDKGGNEELFKTLQKQYEQLR
ncbi:DnaJ domain-containing protein [Priestia flexa]|uniref:DnaJ domain-containing protein n=1 Tax=Priestia flexa TaxID=86664 RepID=UPI003D288917